MPERIQRKRTKGWRMPEGAVYVGRGSKWGNPFEVGGTAYVNILNGGPEQYLKVTPELACILYRERLKNCREQLGLPDISELRGKNLACWCSLDKPCHADVLLEIANDSE